MASHRPRLVKVVKVVKVLELEELHRADSTCARGICVKEIVIFSLRQAMS